MVLLEYRGNFSFVFTTNNNIHMADLASTRAMDSWMSDVKVVRIPRPKFASTSGGTATAGHGVAARRPVRRYPVEPPTDYCMDTGSSALDRATEELRRAVQEKL
ncbi:hypothetical protein B566_EDAN012959 [Ephemera danica]|nr:hypothetical protein B566_EDAN012959 [Ephemera danica]